MFLLNFVLIAVKIVILSSCLIRRFKAENAELIHILNGKWNLINANQSITVVAEVPGCVHSALEESGVIGDPYFRFNDVDLRWIVLDDWTYYTNFTVSLTELDGGRVAWLRMKGVDTVAVVSINGVEVGRCDNQFIIYNFDVTRYLRIGENEIRVGLRSAVKYASDRSSSSPYDVPPDCPPPQYNGECHANFVRKSQSSFSWDWGPSFPTQAIWKDVDLIFSTYQVLLTDVLIQPIFANDVWYVNATVSFSLPLQPFVESRGILTIDIGEPIIGAHRQNVAIDRNNTVVSAFFPVRNVSLWYPRGFARYGGQRLYNATVAYVPFGFRQPIVRTKTFGFRRVEVVQDTITNGLTFYFKVNGLDMYLKGANWIPIDSFIDRTNGNKLKNLLDAAVLANMNVLRVWGGGVYESDRFYELCDRLGLMVWQDFMFACAMYPVDAQFLQSVRQEVTDQVMRMGSHPSIIAWSGNNENEAAIVGNWYGTAGPLYGQYKKDYVRLYIDTVMDTLLGYDATRPFVSSSASNGLQLFIEYDFRTYLDGRFVGVFRSKLNGNLSVTSTDYDLY